MDLSAFFHRLLGVRAPTVPAPAPRPKLEISAEPDRPIPFGYKTSWFALLTDDAEAVVAALELADVQPANWATGVPVAYDRYGGWVGTFPVFVTPPVQGWVLAIAKRWPELDRADRPSGCSPEFEAFIDKLAAQFAEVRFFATHRVSSYDAWIKVSNGAMERAFSYAGSNGEIYANFGPQTEAERALGLADLTGLDCDEALERLFEEPEEGEPDPTVNEAVTMALASAWSIDPTTLWEMDLPAGLGWIGYRAPIASD